MAIPDPEPGLVVHFNYLWSREYDRGDWRRGADVQRAILWTHAASPLKAHLRKAAERTISALWDRIGLRLDEITCTRRSKSRPLERRRSAAAGGVKPGQW